uniref:Methyltransferase n=1 Tax=Syphacia muris TaxID=451379 RepID=A0A0N5AJJ4_9BILA
MEDVQQQCSDVNVVEKRKQFGTRYLTDESETFNFNAWDSVEWSDEQKAEAEAKVAEQHLHALNTNAAKNLLQNPNQQWQTFYEKHEQKFFMNRNWILTEFPELDTLNKVSDLLYF